MAFKDRQPSILLAGDKIGFVKNLKLADKTVIFSGSNIYHFGLESRVGSTALAALIDRLRSDDFRVFVFLTQTFTSHLLHPA